jgi:hypothetical protein
MKVFFKSLTFALAILLVLGSCGSDKTKTKYINGSTECEAERCKGTTVEGKRCKNETKNCNRYCHVHQDQQ